MGNYAAEVLKKRTQFNSVIKIVILPTDFQVKEGPLSIDPIFDNRTEKKWTNSKEKLKICMILRSIIPKMS
jgi:hypothetical protein